MKEVSVSKRSLFVAVLLGVAVAVGLLVIENIPRQADRSADPEASEENLASTAASTALETIFQVNYLEGQAVWLERICENSTEAGCELFAASAGRLWEKYVDAKAEVTATARAVQKVAGNDTEQVWEMAISLSSPLPGSNKTRDSAYVVVVKTDDGWKFDRFLMPAEIDAILMRQKPTSMPAKEGSVQ